MIDVFMSNLWRWKCGLPEIDKPNTPSFDELKNSEWSVEFERLMRNRLIMGAIRYGRINQKNKPKYDRIRSMIDRLKDYEITGNSENLVDVANICLVEYEERGHQKFHFSASDDKYHDISI